MKILDIAFQDITGLDSLGSDRLRESRFSGSTLVVPATSPALEVASIVDQVNSKQVIVIDDEGEIVGLVVPGVIKKRVSLQKGIPIPSTFRSLLEDLVKDPTEKARQWRHEWLNYERVDDIWCAKGRHYTDENPCSVHG
jgi:hypothetical protein